jgi:hypothetical protein
MTMFQAVVIGIGALLCVAASFAFRGSWKPKLGAFVVALVLFAAAYGVVMLLSFEYASLYVFILPIGPAVIGAIGLIRRRGSMRVVGIVFGALVVLSYAYVATAVSMSNAAYALQGVIHLPTFLKGQEAVRNNLNDPTSATFKGLMLTSYHQHQYMCGEVNARNRMGGLVGFTRFYVPLDDPLPFPFFDNDSKNNSFNQYMRTCYGDNWNKDM